MVCYSDSIKKFLDHISNAFVIFLYYLYGVILIFSLQASDIIR